MIENKHKAIFGMVILLISAYFIFKYSTQLEENTQNLLMIVSSLVALFFINPYINEIFNYKNREETINKKRKIVITKLLVQILGYGLGFAGFYFQINEISYFLFMDTIFIFLGAGLIFYATKHMN